MIAVDGINVVTLTMTGPLCAHVHQRGQPDHLTLVVPDLKLPNLGRLVAKVLVRLDIYLPGATKLVEIIDIIRAKINLQCVEELAHWHPQGHALGPVDVEVQPGRVGTGNC